MTRKYQGDRSQILKVLTFLQLLGILSKKYKVFPNYRQPSPTKPSTIPFSLYYVVDDVTWTRFYTFFLSCDFFFVFLNITKLKTFSFNLNFFHARHKDEDIILNRNRFPAYWGRTFFCWLYKIVKNCRKKVELIRDRSKLTSNF